MNFFSAVFCLSFLGQFVVKGATGTLRYDKVHISVEVGYMIRARIAVAKLAPRISHADHDLQYVAEFRKILLGMFVLVPSELLISPCRRITCFSTGFLRSPAFVPVTEKFVSFVMNQTWGIKKHDKRTTCYQSLSGNT